MSPAYTYAAILEPIAASHRPSTFYPPSTAASGKPCESCLLIFGHLLHPTKRYHESAYDREDVFPDFPSLRATAAQGCQLCSLIRTTIQTEWAVRPMEEIGVGTIRARDGYWDELLAAEWDARVRILCGLVKLGNEEWEAHDDKPRFGEQLSLTFGPLSLSTREEPMQVGESRHHNVVQGIGFKVYTTEGGPQIDSHPQR